MQTEIEAYEARNNTLEREREKLHDQIEGLQTTAGGRAGVGGGGAAGGLESDQRWSRVTEGDERCLSGAVGGA
eukprot:2829609-Pyramimonas_sp.AAC.1